TRLRIPVEPSSAPPRKRRSRMRARLSTDRWRVVSPYLDEALDLSVEQRVPWLSALRAQDGALAADVEALLEEHRSLEREGFLAGGSPARPAPLSLAGQAIGSYTLRSL